MGVAGRDEERDALRGLYSISGKAYLLLVIAVFSYFREGAYSSDSQAGASVGAL
jgi:hypothetical protein